MRARGGHALWPLALTAPFVLLALPATAGTAPARSFAVDYTATLEAPPGVKRVEIWLPYPESDEHQRVSGVKVTAPGRYEVAKEPVHGNSILHLTLDAPAEPKVDVRLSFQVERSEYRRHDLPPMPAATGAAYTGAAEDRSKPAPPPEVAQWLHPDRRVPLDDTIRKLAQKVTLGQRGDLAKARAIYDYVVATMSYDKSGTGWGNGDIYWACDAKRGNCTDFHALFIGLARAVGIPARFEIGLPLPAERGGGEIAGYHCWAEFYLAGYGWVPVDASEAKKHLDKKEYFFGALDENRVQLSVGRDLWLSPRQAGEPLNYFVYPYVEIDGKADAKVARSLRFQDLPPAAAGAGR
ncbi:MAG TPA: transglutaminase domain-containing protein [Thermoanaerobaculia bacterium]|nr:transglutaminase domain-containing protein [Thermoanaerobaculia bacterium]